MSDRIFISHATEDAEMANNIVDYIEKHTDMKCWIAPRDIPSGQSWIASINEAVKNCAAIVLVLSADAAQSDWVLREISTGITLKKNIFPFKLTDKAADSDLYFSVSTLQWINGTVNPKSKFPELVEALRGEENKVYSEEQVSKPKPSLKWIAAAVALAAVVLAVVLAIVQPWNHNSNNVLEQSTDMVDSIETETAMVGVDEEEVQANSFKPKATSSAMKGVRSSKTDLQKESKTVEETSNVVVVEKSKETNLTVEEKVPEVQPAEQEEVKPQERLVDTKEIAYKKKYDKATKLYAAKKYEQALVLFKELKQEKPHEGSLDAYIASCQQKMSKD